MPLKKNDYAPDFELASTSGSTFSLQTVKGEPLVLFFYPKNFTSVCTKEVCEFRDSFASFRQLETRVLGISQDSIASHQKFKDENSLPFELLSDPNGKVARLYKAVVPVLNMNKRVTYLLDQDHKVRAVYENMFNADKHIKEMLSSIKSGDSI